LTLPRPLGQGGLFISPQHTYAISLVPMKRLYHTRHYKTATFNGRNCLNQAGRRLNSCSREPYQARHNVFYVPLR
jgi:hypothetical protein